MGKFYPISFAASLAAIVAVLLLTASSIQAQSAFWIGTSGNITFSEDMLRFISGKSPDYVVLNTRREGDGDNSFYDYANTIARLKKENPNLAVLGYGWLHRLHATTYQDAQGNEHKYPRIGGFFYDYLKNNYDSAIFESFYLHDEQGYRICGNTTYFCFTDTANPVYQEAFLAALDAFFKTYPELDGILFDGLVDYPEPPEGATINSRHQLLSRINGPRHFGSKLILVNGLRLDLPEKEYQRTRRYFRSADGGAIEFFCSLHNYQPIDFDTYIKPYLRVMKQVANGETYDPEKIILVYGRIGTDVPFKQEEQQEKYCLASFLLGKTEHSYFKFHRNFQSSFYETKRTAGLSYYDNQDLDLGDPLTDYFIENGIYQRRFEKGYVLVAPDDLANPVNVTLDKNYYDGNGKHYEVDSTITLEPTTAFILITTQPCNNNGICEATENNNSCSQDCQTIVSYDFEEEPKYQLPFQLDVNDRSVLREFSTELKSYAIKVDYNKADTSKWYQKKHFLKLERIYRPKPAHNVSFRLKTSDPSVVLRFYLRADDGTLYGEHFPLLVFVPGPREYVSNPAPGIARIGIGENLSDGTWKTVSLNLNDELKRAVVFNNYTVHKIDTMSIQGSFEIDDVALSYQPVCPKGDLNCDGHVNFLDLLHWRRLLAQGETEADTNGDGKTNVLDYLAVLLGWLSL